MNIAGIQKITLVDFPAHLAAIIFTQGCNFRCGFCHNPELVLPEKFNQTLDNGQIFDFLESRYGKLNGVCITGGEPCLQKDIDKFISHIKALGFDVKLDTNGSFPDKLEKIIEDGDVDYIAMDIKAPPNKYAMTISNDQLSISNQTIEPSNNQHSDVISTHPEPTGGWSEGGEKSHNKLAESIQKSIKLIMDSGIDYEFRTTVCHPLHEVADFKEIGELLASFSPPARGGARGGGSKPIKRYFIQNFAKSKHIDEHSSYTPFTDEELAEAKKIMEEFVKEAGVR